MQNPKMVGLKYPPGALRIVLLIISFTGLALIVASGIVALCVKNNRDVWRGFRDTTLTTGFLFSGIGSLIIVFYNISRRCLRK